MHWKLLLKKDRQVILKPEVWAKISDYPADMDIVQNALKQGKTIEEALLKVKEKFLHFSEKLDDEVWSKETIEQKLGRKLTNEDYEDNLRDDKTNLSISDLIRNSPKALKIVREINNIQKDLPNWASGGN